MIVFGSLVTHPAEFERGCLPTIAALGEADLALITATDTPAGQAYNEILQAASDFADLEAVVLVDEDARITDHTFLAAVRTAIGQGRDALDVRRAAVLPASTGGPTDVPAALSTAVEGHCLVLSARTALDIRFTPQDATPTLPSYAGRHAAPSATAPAASGTRASGDSSDHYYGFERPELVALVPPTARRVLDVGCAGGALGAAIKRRIPGVHVTGLEYVPEVVAQAAQRLDAAHQIDLNTATSLPAEPRSFDAMVFGDVLEHLLDPEETLRRLLPYLAPDGVVIASIPNTVHWSVLIPALAQDRWQYTDEGLLDRTHVHLFTLTEARRMFDAVGLTELVSQGANVIPPPEPWLMEPLVSAVRAYGVPEQDPADRFNAYQYLLVLRRGLAAYLR